MIQKPAVHGPQMPGGAPNPVGERRTVERDALSGVDLRLAIERQVIGVFGNEYMGDGRLGRQAAFDQLYKLALDLTDGTSWPVFCSGCVAFLAGLKLS